AKTRANIGPAWKARMPSLGALSQCCDRLSAIIMSFNHTIDEVGRLRISSGPSQLPGMIVGGFVLIIKSKETDRIHVIYCSHSCSRSARLTGQSHSGSGGISSGRHAG